MSGNQLFDLPSEYSPEFEQAWKRFGNKLDKADAFTAWRQTGPIRPPLDLLLLCIDEYTIRIKKTRTSQKYLAGWLRKKRWEDDLENARYRLEHPATAPSPRKFFRAADLPHPDTRPTKSAAEIIAQARRG